MKGKCFYYKKKQVGMCVCVRACACVSVREKIIYKYPVEERFIRNSQGKKKKEPQTLS